MSPCALLSFFKEDRIFLQLLGVLQQFKCHKTGTYIRFVFYTFPSLQPIPPELNNRVTEVALSISCTTHNFTAPQPFHSVLSTASGC